jgi:hypothetical protein
MDVISGQNAPARKSATSSARDAAESAHDNAIGWASKNKKASGGMMIALIIVLLICFIGWMVCYGKVKNSACACGDKSGKDGFQPWAGGTEHAGISASNFRELALHPEVPPSGLTCNKPSLAAMQEAQALAFFLRKTKIDNDSKLERALAGQPPIADVITSPLNDDVLMSALKGGAAPAGAGVAA